MYKYLDATYETETGELVPVEKLHEESILNCIRELTMQDVHNRFSMFDFVPPKVIVEYAKRQLHENLKSTRSI